MQNTEEPDAPPAADPLADHPSDVRPTTDATADSPADSGVVGQAPPTGPDYPTPASPGTEQPMPTGTQAYPPATPFAGPGRPEQGAAGAFAAAGPGYPAAPGYTDPGHPTAGYPTSGYPSGYPTPEYSTSGYTAPGYTAPGYAGPGYATAGSSSPWAVPAAPATSGYAGPGSPPPLRRLTRSRDDRVLSGVLGGLARYWNTDPLLLRILTIVLTIATGGALLLGYIIAWIVIPLDQDGPGGWPAGTGYAAGGNPAYGAPGSPESPGAAYEAAPRPPRSYLGWLVVSIGLILAGVLAIVGIFTQSASVAALICAVILIVLGAGLIAGTWYGRARWLIVLAVPMVFVTMAAVAASSWVQSPAADRWIASSDGGVSVGTRAWSVTPQDLADQPLDYRVTAGDAVLDLTELTALGATEPGRPAQRVTVTAGVGLGQLVVRIPADMRLNLAASVRAGEVRLPGDPPGQLPPSQSGTDLDVQTTVQPVTDGQPAYVVDLDVALGVGNLEVRREAA